MTAAQIISRRRQVLQDAMEVPHHYRNPKYRHRRSYDHGDLRCTHCKKWLNPNNPEEDIEMDFDKNGGRIHSDNHCPVNSPYVARMVMFAKYRPARSQRVDNVKRY
jgi:hypothetical protein